MPQTLTFYEMFQRSDWASLSLSFILENSGTFGWIILLIGASSVVVFMKRQICSIPGGGRLFAALGIIALVFGVVGTQTSLTMANNVIHSTKGAASQDWVDQAYTAAATTSVLGLVVLIANLIFILVTALRRGSGASQAPVRGGGS